MNTEKVKVSFLMCVFVACAIVFWLMVLGIHLKRIQLDSNASFMYENSRQSTRVVRTAGYRGRILDRDGVVIADNRRTISIGLSPSYFERKTWNKTVEAVADGIIKASKIIERETSLTSVDLRRHVEKALAMPLVVWRDVTDEELARFCEHSQELPGFFCIENEERVYPYGNHFSHLLGYVGRDNAQGESGDEKINFYQQEMIGRSGIERYYNGFLRGVSGEKRIVVDARGFSRSERVVSPATRGLDLKLTVSSKIQRAVEKELSGLRGACVVLDPRDGSVLAMASAPDFDLNNFVPRLKEPYYEALSSDRAKPLLNRAIQGLYAPGSTFKPVTALAALRAGIKDSEKFECIGAFTLGQLRIRCARTWGHGEEDMRGALRDSCNPYFCNLAIRTGTNILIRAAHDFNLGSPTGIDYGIDPSGLIPDEKYKRETYNEKWYQGDLAQMAIGQGMLLVTPLQMAMVAGAIGTGYITRPHLNSVMPVEKKPLAFSEAHLKVVREGMEKVTQPGGTGHKASIGLKVKVAGKTGTAEIGRGATRRKNAWFVAYAPIENPVVAIAMVVEYGDSGGGTAAPKVRRILGEIFGYEEDGR